MRVKSEERRQAILDIAKKSFLEQGFEKTSMSFISKELGGSKATLYNYFDSKEEIFEAVMHQGMAEQILKAFLMLKEKSDLESDLKTFGFKYLRSLLSPEPIAIYRMAVSESERSNLGRQFYANGPEKGIHSISNYLQNQVEGGALVECDTTLAAFQLQALLNASFIERYALGAIEAPSDAQIKQHVEFAIDCFLKLYRKA